jgi:hypothetical protein
MNNENYLEEFKMGNSLQPEKTINWNFIVLYFITVTLPLRVRFTVPFSVNSYTSQI